MKVSNPELVGVVVILLYIAFVSHSPPKHLSVMLENVYVSVAVFAGIAYVTLYESRSVGVLLILAFILTMTRVTEHLAIGGNTTASIGRLSNIFQPSTNSVAKNTPAPSQANIPIPTASKTPTAPAVPPPATTTPAPVASKTATPSAPVAAAPSAPPAAPQAKPMSLSELQKRSKEVEADLVYLQGLGLHPATNDTLRDRLAEKLDLDKKIKALGSTPVVTQAPKKIYPPLPPIPMPSLGPTPVLEYFGGFR